VPGSVRVLAAGERRLAWGLTSEGTPVVATATSLHIAEVILSWSQVEKAVWLPPLLTVTEVAEREGTGAVHELTLEQENHLPEVVRERVTASVGWTDVHRLTPSGKVRLVGRRVPGVADLLWQVVYLQGTDPTQPGVREQAEQLVAALRGTLG
jgi:hypothetical protein